MATHWVKVRYLSSVHTFAGTGSDSVSDTWIDDTALLQHWQQEPADGCLILVRHFWNWQLTAGHRLLPAPLVVVGIVGHWCLPTALSCIESSICVAGSAGVTAFLCSIHCTVTLCDDSSLTIKNASLRGIPPRKKTVKRGEKGFTSLSRFFLGGGDPLSNIF